MTRVGRALRTRRGLLAIALMLCGASFASLEVMLRLRAWPNRVEVYDARGQRTTRDISHEILGYGPRAGQRFSMKIFAHNKPAVAFSYSIDRNGLRRSSPAGKPQPKECTLFFGGSIPFGEGVEDDESVPFLVGEALEGRYSTYNFGYFYYGAHQMLAALQSGLVKRIVKCHPRYAIYFGLVAHVRRATYADVPFLERTGPMYTMGPVARPILEEPQRWRALLAPLIDWSRATSWLENRLALTLDTDATTKQDLRLYVDIVEESREELQAIFEDVKFHLIFWDEKQNPSSEWLISEFKRRKIRIHLISDIFPGYDFATMGYSLGSRYRISDSTWQYNGKAYERIAEYIQRRIMKSNDRRERSGA